METNTTNTSNSRPVHSEQMLHAPISAAILGSVLTASILLGISAAGSNAHTLLIIGIISVSMGVVAMLTGILSNGNSLGGNRVSLMFRRVSGAIGFALGGIIPTLSMYLVEASGRVPITFAVSLLLLIVLGFLSARIRSIRIVPAMLYIVVSGVLTLAIVYGIGSVLDATGV